MHGPNQAKKKKIVHFNGIRKIEFSKKKIKKEIMKIWIKKKAQKLQSSWMQEMEVSLENPRVRTLARGRRRLARGLGFCRRGTRRLGVEEGCVR